MTVTVDSGGDYPAINSAIEALNLLYPTYKQNGINVEIKLLSGFVMAEQILVKNVDLGWMTIKAEDAVTFIKRSSLTAALVPNNFPCFGSIDGVLPNIGCLFSMDTSGLTSDAIAFIGYSFID